MSSSTTGRIDGKSILEGPAQAGVTDEFLDVAPLVYADDRAWIPEDRDAVRARFSSRNSWFDRGDAHVWCVPGSARLAAFVEQGVRVGGRPVAFFGYWETLGEPGADRILFDRAEAWARVRGAETLFGPVDFTTFGRYRLCTGGDATMRPFFQEPHNPGGYPPILEGLGFCATDTRYASLVLSPDVMHRLADDFAPHFVQARAAGYRIEPLTADLWTTRLPELHRLCDVVFGEQFAYTPISFDEFHAACGEHYARRIAPDISAIAWAPDDKIAAFAVTMPDWSPLLNRETPHRLHAEDLDHDRHRSLVRDHPPTNALIRSGGVVPVHRRQGLAYAVLGWVFRRVVDRGEWDHATVGIVTVGNAIDRLLRPHAGATRTYALYRRELT